ncbi:hypothetical protein TELCIR_01930 [Teladorsagia circumcincta]|uniref:Uncharacterized protein n=1 Tax=Teladorsagia circumcincta TaxID=45464 RepID=A0A2G9V0K2_TELCI|nr:hypothetical protein TELCIR_01930 [Teladorsagia circumcincta]
MYRLLSILPLLLFTTLLSETSASLTLLITGHSGVNVDKQQLARQFVASYDEIIKESPSQLIVFTNGVAVPVAVEERHEHGIWDDTHLAGNVTTVIVTNLGIDEMNTDQLVIIQRLMKTTAPLVVIEFGQFTFPPLFEIGTTKHEICLTRPLYACSVVV